MNKVFKIAVFVAFNIVLNSCKNENKDNFYGYYGIDKTVSKNKNNNLPDYTVLKVNKNNTFELRNNRNDSINTIKGSFSYENFNNDEKIIVFSYNGKKIKGELKGSIFYFNYPNDFHNDKYQSSLYVRLNK